MFIALNLVAHAAALLSVLINSLYSSEIVAILIVLIVTSGFHQCRRLDALMLRVSGDHWFVDNGTAEELISPLFSGKWFLVLRLSASGFVLIARDSVSAADFRRLSVLLRSRASRMMAV